ncbi:MAG TPA: tyrosine--tRNA ligase [Bacteroidales bacterium]|nr:tyrosine--tRNA ligase [Bacteroidales bacterium]
MTFVEELRWRGMIHDMMPGTEEQLKKESTAGYIGFDPTADSLHIGNLLPIMLLVHFQKAGHKPVVLVGGATGMVGDPSGKSEERKFLDEDTLRHNLTCQKKQLEKFLDFNCGGNSAEIVNNYDWFRSISFLDFLRDVGKHITVNYMLTKDSVKKRLETGISFTEFSYQLVQGYDFYFLYKHKNCRLQMGGSDQWGNIVTGTELIRRKDGGEAYALTCPLVTRSDGGKFGKSEKGNVWLDPAKSSTYTFYQFWLNVSDEDAEKYIKIFTLLTREEIEELIGEHKKAPHLRLLQKKLATDVTLRVHSQEGLDAATEASEILFGKGTTETLKKLDEGTFLSVFEGVPLFTIEKETLETGINILDLLGERTSVFPSKGEVRRMIKGGGVSLNKARLEDDSLIVKTEDLLNNKYILIQKGKKNYYLIASK